MSPAVLSAAAAVGTFVVIATTAIAAIIQLRHLRDSNQLQALLTVLRMPYEPVLRAAFDFTTHSFPERMKDYRFRSMLDQSTPADRTEHKELYVCDYYERLGSYIKDGLIAEDLYLDNSSPERYWDILYPAIAILRRRRGPVVYENFEFLVARSREWQRRHPQGNYPSTVPRLDVVDEWSEIDRGAAHERG